MSHPFHGSDCSSYTYPAKCRDCGKPVFIYGCSCGSWVMFNELGAPWPQHLCFDEQYRALRKQVLEPLQTAASPKSGTFHAFQILKDYFETSDTAVPATGSDPAPAVVAPVPQRDESLPAIKSMGPFAGDEQSFIGVIRERLADSARLDELYGGLGAVGVRTLGLPPRSQALQLTIVDTRGPPQESFTCVVDRKVLGPSLGLGVMAFANLKAKSAPSALFWLATSVEPL